MLAGDRERPADQGLDELAPPLREFPDRRAVQGPLRGEEFAQITKDDTYVQLLVDEGRITLEEAATHPQRSLVSRVLQGQPTDPVYSVTAARAGDRYLLCSDGLSGVLRAEIRTMRVVPSLAATEIARTRWSPN